MPNMADITVKKADGTTSITYTALSPSAGDNVPAQWRCESVAAAAGLRPTLTLVSKWNGPKTARRVDGNFQFPETVTDSTTSTTKVRNRIPISFSAVVPAEVPDTVVAEAVAQGYNLFASALVQSSVKSGFAPT